MAKESSGIIYDDATYSADQIAAIYNRDLEKVKAFVRQSGCRYVVMLDSILISGRNWRLAIEAASQPSNENVTDTRTKRGKELQAEKQKQGD